MPFHDLSIAYTSDHVALSNTLLFAGELGYEVVAISIAIAGNLPSQPPTIPVSTITKPDNVRILSRLTLTISDTTQNHRLPSLTSSYDIIAVRPTNEKALQHCCSSLECDLISIDFSQRLPFVLKFKTVASALQRGVRFEICYSAGIVAGNDARRNLISGATQLIRGTRGRGIVVSSEAKSALGSRAPWDVINLAQVWGLSQERAKEALCEEAGKVVRLASIKRTSYRGVVDIIDGGTQTPTISSEKQVAVKTTPGVKSKLAQEHAATPDAKEGTPSTANGTKRKASISSLAAPQVTEPEADKPISKREMKRRAKKAKLEGKASSSIVTTDNPSKAFPLQHESLMPNKPK